LCAPCYNTNSIVWVKVGAECVRCREVKVKT
jgi:hypothetical protein